MAWVRCDKGHYYDDERHSLCPYCGVQDLAGQVTVLHDDPLAMAEEKTVRRDEGLQALGGTGEGQTVAYVADINGALVELCTPVGPPAA